MNLRTRIALDTGLPYKQAGFIINKTEEEMIDAEREERDTLEAIERDYVKNELPKVRENVNAMIEEFKDESTPEEWSALQESRRAYLEKQLEYTKQQFLDACAEYARKEYLPFTGMWVLERVQKWEKRLLKLGMDAKIHVGKAEGISPEKIARARESPIANLIKSVKGMALCPFHNEKHASMDIRNNFYFCYGCSAQGDVIDFVMKTEGISFKEAVNKLSA